MYVLQVGANDGHTIDPLHRIIKQPSTKAVVVEAAPYLFKQLVNTYRDYPHVLPINAVVVEAPTQADVPFYFFEPKAGLPFDQRFGWWGSLNKDYIAKYTTGNELLQQLLTIQQLPAKSLFELYVASGFPRLDILHTDVESMDVALVQSWPFDINKPSVILFEHLHASKADHIALLNKLTVEGYRCYVHAYDTLCVYESSGFKTPWLSFIKFIRPSLLAPVES